MNENKTNINWYPGHMKKTTKEIRELMPVIDFVIEVLDGRVPKSSKINNVDDIIRNKPCLMVLTKKDLCDENETKKWVKYYEEQGKLVAFVDLKSHSDYKILINKLDEIVKIVNQKRIDKGLKIKEPRGLVMGVPNSGKSTLINVLAKKKVANTGNVPGFTKSLSWLKAGNFMLLDSPGILWPKFENENLALNLASTSAIREEVLPIGDVSYHILSLLDKYYPDKLYDRYGIKNLSDDTLKDYETIAKKLNILSIGNTFDLNKVYKFILNDVRVGNIKGITFDRRD